MAIFPKNVVIFETNDWIEKWDYILQFCSLRTYMIAILEKLMAIFLGICVQVLYSDFPFSVNPDYKGQAKNTPFIRSSTHRPFWSTALVCDPF